MSNRCYVCAGSIKTYSHKVDGKLVCSAFCYSRYTHWRDNEQLSLPFPKPVAVTAIKDEEADICRCVRCYSRPP